MKNISRLLGLAVGLGVLYAGMTTEAADKKKAKQLRHFVCFKYKAEASKEKIAEVEKAFVALKKNHGNQGVREGDEQQPRGTQQGV